MSQSGYRHLDDVEIKKATDLAFLIVYDGEEIWVPKSQVADAEDYNEGDTECTLSVTEWFCNKEGI